MLFTSLLIGTAAFSGYAYAQNDTSNLPPGIGPCCTVDPNQVPQDMRNDWCLAQRNTCPELCGGIPQLARSGQKCDTQTLEYECECRNGTKPDVAKYQQSVPAQMCLFWFDQCIQASNENLEQQVQCTTTRDERCGNLTTDGNAAETSASQSASPTPTGSGSGNQQSPSSTAASPSSATSGAATALALAREYGTPLLVGGIAAAFGLAL